MTKYKCVKRLTTDNHQTIHEVGDVVDLNPKHAESALKQGAVVPVEDAPKAPAQVKDQPKGDA